MERLSEVDQLKLQLALSRVRASEAELKLARQAKDKTLDELCARYQIAPHDLVDPETGMITRVPAKTAPAPEGAK